MGNLKKYVITNPGDSRSHLVFMHKTFARMLPHESLGYKLTCCISNTITMTIEVDTSTTLYGDELCVVIDLDT